MTRDINVSGHHPTSEKSLFEQNELAILIRECIAQSRSAQKKLYDHYAPEVYGIIKKIVYNNEPVAKEILNDTFFKIFRDLHQYSFQGSFKGWMRSIVVNTAADHLRKNIRHEEHIKDVQPEDVFINSEPVDNLSHKELLKMISSLPDAQREVFSLFVFEDFSHKEIANMLNIKQNNCRWHLNDARRRLKEMITAITK